MQTELYDTFKLYYFIFFSKELKELADRNIKLSQEIEQLK